MRIAIASDNGKVTGHFGHCEGFIVFDEEGGNIVKEEFIQNPGHKPGFLPKFLAERNIDVIISGGMGGGAVNLFNENGIEVILGASGDSRNAAEAYLRGELKSSESVCHEHRHHHHHRGGSDN